MRWWAQVFDAFTWKASFYPSKHGSDGVGTYLYILYTYIYICMKHLSLSSRQHRYCAWMMLENCMHDFFFTPTIKAKFAVWKEFLTGGQIKSKREENKNVCTISAIFCINKSHYLVSKNCRNFLCEYIVIKQRPLGNGN